MTLVKTRDEGRKYLPKLLEQVRRHSDKFTANEPSPIVAKTLVILNYLLKVTVDVSEAVKSRIVTDTLREIIAGNTIDDNSFIARLNSNFGRYLKQPLNQYIFVTHIALDQKERLKR